MSRTIKTLNACKELNILVHPKRTRSGSVLCVCVFLFWGGGVPFTASDPERAVGNRTFRLWFLFCQQKTAKKCHWGWQSRFCCPMWRCLQKGFPFFDRASNLIRLQSFSQAQHKGPSLALAALFVTIDKTVASWGKLLKEPPLKWQNVQVYNNSSGDSQFAWAMTLMVCAG